MGKTKFHLFLFAQEQGCHIKKRERGRDILLYYEQRHLTEGVPHSHIRLHPKQEKDLSLKS